MMQSYFLILLASLACFSLHADDEPNEPQQAGVAAVAEDFAINVEEQVNLTEAVVVNAIYTAVLDTVKNQHHLIIAKKDKEESLKNAKKISEEFVSKYISANKLAELDSFQQQDPLGNVLLEVIANKVALDVLDKRSPLKGYLEMIAATTQPQNLINLILIESLNPTKELIVELRKKYSDEVIKKALLKINQQITSGHQR